MTAWNQNSSSGWLERLIAALYRIEADIRGRSPDERQAQRQARSLSLVSDLHDWFEAQMAKLFTRGPAAEAIGYALNHWDGLTRFLDDGRLDLDTNAVERCMRPVALGRKNALFAGRDEGGENWGAVASLIETCKLNSVDPQHYLAELLHRLVNGWLQSRIDDLVLTLILSPARTLIWRGFLWLGAVE